MLGGMDQTANGGTPARPPRKKRARRSPSERSVNARLNVLVDPIVKEKANERAAAEGVTLSRWIEERLFEALSTDPKASA